MVFFKLAGISGSPEIKRGQPQVVHNRETQRDMRRLGQYPVSVPRLAVIVGGGKKRRGLPSPGLQSLTSSPRSIAR